MLHNCKLANGCHLSEVALPMLWRSVLTDVALMSLAVLATAETYRVKGRVDPYQAPLEIVVDAELVKGNGFQLIQSITVQRDHKVRQTIQFLGEKPTVPDLSKAVMLKDVNCDGHKDLLVQY